MSFALAYPTGFAPACGKTSSASVDKAVSKRTKPPNNCSQCVALRSRVSEKKMVWNFAPDKAIGTIASVCLTHKNCGYFGFGVDDYFNCNVENCGQVACGKIIGSSKKGKQSPSMSDYGIVGTSTALDDGSYVDYCVDIE